MYKLCIQHDWERDVHVWLLVGKPGGRRALGRSTLRWEDIKINF
jgi:hypothetical protein